MELKIASGDKPFIQFETRVVCGSAADIKAFIQQQAQDL